MVMETIIRPFVNNPADAQSYVKPGQRGVDPVILRVGTKGGTKTFHFSHQFSCTMYMSRKHMENKPRSQSLTTWMGQLGGGASYAGLLAGWVDGMNGFAGSSDDGTGNTIGGGGGGTTSGGVNSG